MLKSTNYSSFLRRALIPKKMSINKFSSVNNMKKMLEHEKNPKLNSSLVHENFVIILLLL